MTLPNWWSRLFKELGLLAGAFGRIAATANLSISLENAIQQARARAGHFLQDESLGRIYREITLPDLEICSPVAAQLHPPGTAIGGTRLRIIYACYDDVDQKSSFGYDEIDRIRRADFQVVVEGIVQFGSALIDLQEHWRVDTHYFQGESREPHPLFHFQRGGHAQDIFAALPGFLPGECLADATFPPETKLRSLMQTQTPRLALPPMDPVCAIDFVVGQHDGRIRSALWGMPEYAGAVRRAQERLWEPYFELLRDKEHRRKLMPFFGPARPTAP